MNNMDSYVYREMELCIQQEMDDLRSLVDDLEFFEKMNIRQSMEGNWDIVDSNSQIIEGLKGAIDELRNRLQRTRKQAGHEDNKASQGTPKISW